jgi:hypothetical protein
MKKLKNLILATLSLTALSTLTSCVTTSGGDCCGSGGACCKKGAACCDSHKH